MLETLRGVDRSRGARGDSIRFGTGAPGLERAEVFFSGCAFELHRHDTYAIAITTAGVQTFRYRGTRRYSLPGQLVVLHPDEVHDGAAGTDDGFGYRALYVAPELLRDALGGCALPFVADPVQEQTPASRRVASLLSNLDGPISDLALAEIAATLADALRALSGRSERRPVAIDARAVSLARDFLAAHPGEPTPASDLERITGTDRFTLARHFRRAFGTSPDRYRTMRRLALARAAIESGLQLVQVAVYAGFADQSHLTRQFKRAYGLTPARWAALIGAEARSAPTPPCRGATPTERRRPRPLPLPPTRPGRRRRPHPFGRRYRSPAPHPARLGSVLRGTHQRCRSAVRATRGRRSRARGTTETMPAGAARTGTSRRIQASATSGVERSARAYDMTSAAYVSGTTLAASTALVLNDSAARTATLPVRAAPVGCQN
jgi:AraC-like DNA-binding protein